MGVGLGLLTFLESAAVVASRLTVIISQTAAGHAHYTEIEEALLAELMMTTGLDATLVGALEHVQIDSTDYLCLSGFAQSIALVSGLPATEVARHWSRLGLPGQVLPIGEEQRSNERRVHYLSLQQGVLPIIGQLKQLLADRNVRTVGLSLPLVSKPGAVLNRAQPNTSVPVTVEPTLPQESGSGMSNSTSAAETVPAEKRGASLHGAEGGQSESYDLEWPNLDRLVDDFDALDL